VSAARTDGPLRVDLALRDAREFTSVQIAIASPKSIREWSYGEVTKPETINYRTLKPEREGLFDEKIFGPEKDWECSCGKYRGQRFASKVCERCMVEVTKSTVRRYRMGHIVLATPCAHIWYVKDVPSKIGALLNLSTTHLEQVLYFGRYIVTDPQEAKLGGRPLRAKDLLTDDEYRQLRYGQQETYSVQLGEQALVADGEMVEQGQPLAKGVKSKLAGIAQYRFPRKITIDYRELRDARLILPKVAWIEEERYAGGQPIAELETDLELRAEEEGIVELLPIGADGGILLLRNPDDSNDARYAYLIAGGMEVVSGSGEFVEAGDVLARAKAGTRLFLPREAVAGLRASKTKDKMVTMTLEVRWARRDVREVYPTMHVLVGDGAHVMPGEKIVGAIDPAQELIADAEGNVHLSEPASIIVSRARVYPYQDEPIVVNGDRVRPGDELADAGAVRSDISGRVEIDLVRRSVRVIESYDFEARMGADAVRELLELIDLEKLEAELVEEMNSPSRHKRAKARKRLEITRSFLKSGNDPAWMILEVVPIMPPDLRPMVQVEGGRFATSDLNDLYRRLINRNNRLKKLMAQGAPEMIVRNEKRMLQEAVDALIDNGRRGSAVVHPGSDRPLRSLTDLLGGKQGRFRQNLLGKRVDYSGRSVIVVGPQLKLHQCGVPKRMALELFKPFLYKKLEERGIVSNIKSARKLLDRYRDTRDDIWDALEEVIADRVVLLNRAPTLHRLGIQAFEPVLVEGQAIQLHPLVCEAFNADFDGDQMAIHVPLSVYAQAEARLQMLSSHNLLSPAHGNPNVQAARDIILGLFVLTQVHTGRKGVGMEFTEAPAAIAAYREGVVDLNSTIVVAGKETSIGRLKYRFASDDEALLAAERGDIDMQDVVTVKIDGKLIETSPGRVFFARLVRETLAEDGGEVPASMIRYDIAYEKGALRDLTVESFKRLGIERTAKLLDGLKQAGFQLSTTSGITIGIDDVAIPPTKKALLAEAQAKLEKIQEYAAMGFVTEQERYQQVVRLWNDTTEQVKQAVFENFERNMPFNPLYVMAQSGARGNPQQIRQLAGMRGLMAKPSGDTIELPIRANFREGLDVLEYFISTHGARKGGADTALRTADSGYLTRKLVDVAHELVIREDDCGTADFIDISLYTPEGRVRSGSQLEMSLYGRTLAADLTLGDLHYATGVTLMREDVEAINKRFAEYPDVREVAVRSPLTCQTPSGVCRTCYGLDMSMMRPVSLGEAVGVIAAESIGEPGTQLTMRTFHTGGIATGGDITQGLPRVIELVEARKPKLKAVVADLDGVVTITDEDDRVRLTVTSDDDAFTKLYKLDKNTRILVRDGDRVEAGQQLTRGAINPHDLLETRGPSAVQAYLVDEIQRVYRGQGVSVHDKHIETIVRQMLKYVEILESGDSEMLEGQTVERFDVEGINDALLEAGKRPAAWKPVLLGITKASLTTKSWLSAASFQHTTHVLTEAAVAGKIDDLVGLKENVILGRLIPAGTGLDAIRHVRVADERTLAKQRAAAVARTEGTVGVPSSGSRPSAPAPARPEA
jgi:DNA-directed RNA polymerase subunit beta'